MEAPMNDILTFLETVAPPVVALAIGVVLLKALGPADWSIFRHRPEESWPRGVQEEDPRPWDFTAPGPEAPPVHPAGPAGRE
jgi:hypothetical protein